MRLLTPSRLFLIACAVLFITASASAQFNGPGSVSSANPEINRPVTITTDQAILFPATHDVLLTPGDLVSIHVFSQADYTPTVRIGEERHVFVMISSSYPSMR